MGSTAPRWGLVNLSARGPVDGPAHFLADVLGVRERAGHHDADVGQGDGVVAVTPQLAQEVPEPRSLHGGRQFPVAPVGLTERDDCVVGSAPSLAPRQAVAVLVPLQDDHVTHDAVRVDVQALDSLDG